MDTICGGKRSLVIANGLLLEGFTYDLDKFLLWSSMTAWVEMDCVNFKILVRYCYKRWDVGHSVWNKFDRNYPGSEFF